ncbi:MAG: hypothetical protein Q9160_003606 [Pyrenula sp. 1 TL-2023]
MDSEKQLDVGARKYPIDESPPNYTVRDRDRDIAAINEEKGYSVGEAADVYGDLEDAETYGYVSRGLKSRHIQFIALGGTIGTGLFLGIGRALTQAGPLSILLGYTFTGIAIYAMMQSLGEMATWLPLPGAIPQFCARYADDALGFAVGWNNWYSSSITLCAEISAASIVIDYWNGAQGINVAAWISIIIVVVVCLNIFAVAIYGEAEFIFASVKIITIVGLLILALIIDLGGVPGQDRLGFATWRNPGAMKEYIGHGDTGRFAGLFSTLVNAAFSYGGVEMVAVAAGEAENPRKNIPKAARRVFWRILFFYVLGSLAIGVLVPFNDPHLLSAQEAKAAGAAASPWVIAIQRAGIKALPSIINAVILTSASSSANAFLYTGVDRNTMVFKSPFQPYLAYGALIYFAMIIVFNGFYAFAPWAVDDFITSYVGIPIFFVLFFSWKVIKRTRPVPSSQADIFTGKSALDAADAHWPTQIPRNIFEKIWFWLC